VKAAKPRPKSAKAKPSHARAAPQPFDVGRYGVVRVVAGPHVGMVGYYDDENDEGDAAIVYFGEPFKTTYHEIAYDKLEHVDVKHIGLERLKRDHPELTKQLGLPER
jgi:hypothetical protein